MCVIWCVVWCDVCNAMWCDVCNVVCYVWCDVCNVVVCMHLRGGLRNTLQRSNSFGHLEVSGMQYCTLKLTVL